MIVFQQVWDHSGCNRRKVYFNDRKRSVNGLRTIYRYSSIPHALQQFASTVNVKTKHESQCYTMFE